MAAQRTSFDKLQRDRAKKAKAAAKRDRRINGPGDAATDLGAGADAGDGEAVASHYAPNLSSEEILRRIEEVHQRFDAGDMTYDEFEEHKAELLGRLTVD